MLTAPLLTVYLDIGYSSDRPKCPKQDFLFSIIFKLLQKWIYWVPKGLSNNQGKVHCKS